MFWGSRLDTHLHPQRRCTLGTALSSLLQNTCGTVPLAVVPVITCRCVTLCAWRDIHNLALYYCQLTYVYNKADGNVSHFPCQCPPVTRSFAVLRHDSYIAVTYNNTVFCGATQHDLPIQVY